MNCSEELDCSGSFACHRSQGKIGVADCSKAQTPLISEGFSLRPLFTSPQLKITWRRIQIFLCNFPLTLTFCSVLLGEGEGESKGKFLPLIFTTGSPPKSKAIWEQRTVTFIPRTKHHIFFCHSSYYFPKKSKHRLSEEIMPQSENGMLLWSCTLKNEEFSQASSIGKQSLHKLTSFLK